MGEKESNMTIALQKIDKIINMPIESMTKEEATNILIECGILTKKHKIKKDYKEIIIKVEQNNE